ncbi:YibE/F family protein [Anaerosalibacter sp. Marseille-P3206]|uniref:YibE/F family protein n=1 Tax=Anaerosalibacter sp. Marseille-P3206 TaxID=1871005 RepID=UPI0009846E10|nr:YibE/F family protein [Anaerosalibacter sp. Marseille-P3206]
MKKTSILLIILLLICSLNVYAESVEDSNMTMETAIVLDASDMIEAEEYDGQYQNVKLKITSGKYKNEIVDTENQLSSNFAFNIIVKEGDKVVVSIEEIEDGDINVFITDYMRQHYIFYLTIIFILLILLIGRKKGLKSVITLTITVLAILKILLPMMLKGANPIPITIIISIGITVLTIFVVGGINSKSISAILGTSAGVLIAGLIAYFVGSKIKLTGLSSDEAMMLAYIPQEVNFDFRSLLFSGIILGSLGAVMDVGMSISSAIEEIYNANPDITRKDLFDSGMNVGKDIMGTMTNTLILAYTGSTIPMLLLFMAYETSMVKIINLDIIATEVIRSLAGSIGLVLTIPLTAFIASVLINKNKTAVIDKD